MPQTTIPVFYTERMVSNEHDMLSPSPFKPRQVADAWRSNIDFPIIFIEPVTATLDELCVAHDPTYVRSVLSCQIPNGFGNTQPDIALSLPYTSGSMLSAARHVLKHGGVACSPTSGFHHAC
jgi:acetoin utilization deacetylase AcuC-like enzyme